MNATVPRNPPAAIQELVERFHRNFRAYRGQGYNETQLRREFIDPFFESLGWDVANTAGHAEAYKDVIHEDTIKVGGATKAPDYCFRIGGTRKFFLEAKKPAVNLKEDINPAYQLRRYAWSAKLPLSILTDFEEFAVYDSRTKPKPNDKAGTGRILYLTYQDYLERWDEIASIFSKEAVLKGSFDKYAVSERKRGTATVDKEFLSEIEGWRDALARHLALRNPTLTVEDLNFSVQRTIDRLIFLRICEDRGVEPYGQLQALLNGENTYGRLRALYHTADDRYNSGLFHFHHEKGRAEEPDSLTPNLILDDKVLKDIIRRLYYPESLYEFSVFPVEILGQVYEQFLGKVIRLTAGHQAKIEEKPEVKKAGGVYYTPSYIVEYIVSHTVGKLCEGKTPKQLAKLRILDPACGSGSFLIGAYTYLINYHRDWYVNDSPAKHRKEVFQSVSGEWRLTTQEKKRILLTNIYGLDIDSQAVEVTKLSLLLKVLEGESEETLKRQLSFVGERALPDLGNNIKCGNSLIGPDYFTGSLLPDEEEMRRVNPFDLDTEFPEIMKNGGFDAVIGNPPYGALISKVEAEYLLGKYQATTKDLDTYGLFIEKAIGLCKRSGKVSMIVPTGWYSGAKFSLLRRYLACTTDPESIVNLPYDIFKAWVDTTIFVTKKRHDALNWPRTAPCRVMLRTFPKRHSIQSHAEFERNWESVNMTDWFATGSDEYLTYADTKGSTLIKKMLNRGSPLQDFTDVQRGVTPFVLFDSPRYSTSRPAFSGTVRRYAIDFGSAKYIRFDGTLAEPKPERYFKGPRLLLRELISRQFRLQAVKTEKDFVTNKSMQSILQSPNGPNLNYLLGIINSRLMSWYFLSRSNIAQRDDFPKIVLKESRTLPICPINLSEPEEKEKHDRMVLQVERMLDLHKWLGTASNPNDKTRFQRQIDATDREIDHLVYDLYGLTDEEIAIVEGTPVASDEEACENTVHETSSHSPTRPRRARRKTPSVATGARYREESGGSALAGSPGASGPIHGVRERTGDYGPSADSPQEPSQGVGSTRYFNTSQGTLSYAQLSERLAVKLVRVLDELLHIPPDQLTFSPEWMCLRHKTLAGDLFPDWAGRYRDINVQVGPYTPPPFYEVPTFMRLFCDDLTERVRHISPREPNIKNLSELLAWIDWRFQWIHPFQDFNGPIGRVLLAAVLYKLALPHVETAPVAQDARRQYLDALRTADNGNLEPLTELWLHRLAAAL